MFQFFAHKFTAFLWENINNNNKCFIFPHEKQAKLVFFAEPLWICVHCCMHNIWWMSDIATHCFRARAPSLQVATNNINFIHSLSKKMEMQPAFRCFGYCCCWLQSANAFSASSFSQINSQKINGLKLRIVIILLIKSNFFQ